VFILSCGHRCGSTWLSRAITATRHAFIWNETSLFTHYDMYRDKVPWSDPLKPTEYDLTSWRTNKDAVWAPHLRPFTSSLDSAYKLFMETALGAAANRENMPRWGLKEVTWTAAHVNLIRRWWPRASIVFLARDFDAVYRSGIGTEWFAQEQHKERFVSEWLRMSQLAAGLSNDNRGCLVRYEDLCRDGLNTLFKWLELPAPPVVAVVGSSSAVAPSAADLAVVQPLRGAIEDVRRRLGYATDS